MIWLAVAAGGALGSMARHGVNIFFAPRARARRPVRHRDGESASDRLTIGLLAALLATGRLQLSTEMRTFVFVGILGGFTTFSSFMLDTFTLGSRRRSRARVLERRAADRARSRRGVGRLSRCPSSSGERTRYRTSSRMWQRGTAHYAQRLHAFIESIPGDRRDRRRVGRGGSGPDTSARGRGAAWRRPRTGDSAAAHDVDRVGRRRRHSRQVHAGRRPDAPVARAEMVAGADRARRASCC